jgi:hypothetical protein
MISTVGSGAGPAPLQPVVLSLLLTMALYPLASLLLTRLHDGIPRLAHAP